MPRRGSKTSSFYTREHNLLKGGETCFEIPPQNTYTELVNAHRNPISYLWTGDISSSPIVNKLIEEIYIIVS